MQQPHNSKIRFADEARGKVFSCQSSDMELIHGRVHVLGCALRKWLCHFGAPLSPDYATRHSRTVRLTKQKSRMSETNITHVEDVYLQQNEPGIPTTLYTAC